MTRAAVREGFERFVDDVIEAAHDEFDVVAALTGARAPGDLADRLLEQSRALERRVVRPEIEEYREAVLEQFEVVLAYATADAGIEAFREDLLAADMYVQALRPSLSRERRERIRDRILERHRRLGDAVVPLIEAEADDFWAAARAAFDEDAAVEFVETQFAFTDPLEAFPEAFAFEAEIDPADVLEGPAALLAAGAPTITVEYTDEAVRSLRRAEARTIDATTREVRRRW